MPDPQAATLTPPTGLPVVVPDVPPWRTLECVPESVSRARAHARHVLTRTDPDVADSALLVVSELVTNAIVHVPEGYTPPAGVSPLILLSVRAEAGGVLVAVRDPWPGLPRPRPGRVDRLDQRGRGLWLVDNLSASRWTQVHAHGDKTVSALILPPGAALAPAERDRLHRA